MEEQVTFRGRDFIDDQYTRDNCRRLAEQLTGGDTRHFGIMLCGVSGNGKTTLLYAMQQAHNTLKHIHQALPDPFRQTGIEIIDAVALAMQCTNTRDYHDYSRRPMLAIEDLGRDAEQLKYYGNTITPVIDILEYRYQHQLFTLVTTNLTLRELKAKYGARVADRFNEMRVIIFNNDTSYRRTRNEE